MRIAITKGVSPAIARCELSHVERQAIDVDLVRKQHHAYEQCLSEIGCKLIQLPAEPDFPDCMFVEDTAVILDEVAIITRPGASSRQAETIPIAAILKNYRKLFYIQTPGTIDGGDVLRIEKTLYVGMSGRSNKEGAEQMRLALEPFNYRVIPVKVTGCLHLKSAVTQVAENTILINSNRVDRASFEGVEFVEVDPSEPDSANGLWESGTLIYPSSFPKTAAKLESLGAPIYQLDVSEIAKAEGALTCCSLIFNA